MNIQVRVIPHNQQRYVTVGDWWWDENGDLQIRVSDLGDWRFNALVAHHEQVEALACKRAGIREEDVTAFDKQFENYRKAGNYDEPGDCLRAPYYRQHQIATISERQLALELGVNWREYDEKVSRM